MDNLYDELLSELVISNETVKQEKQEMLSEYIYNIIYLTKKYENSKYLEDTIKYINDNYHSFFIDADREHKFYDLVYNIINTNNELTEDFFEYVNQVFDELEENVVIRINEYVAFTMKCQRMMFYDIDESIKNESIYKSSLNMDNYNSLMKEFKKLIKK